MHEANLKGMSRMSEPRLEGKTHDIPKQLIWDAWLKVKENGGAAGADGVTIEQLFGVIDLEHGSDIDGAAGFGVRLPRPDGSGGAVVVTLSWWWSG